MKIVISCCYGGFGLSIAGKSKYLELKNGHKPTFYYAELEREAYKPKYGFYERVGFVSFSRLEEMEKGAFNCLIICENDLGARLEYLQVSPDKVNGVYPKGAGYDFSFTRNDALLVKVVELLGSETASGHFAQLKVIEIPDNAFWEIDEYDGYEGVRWSMSEIHKE